MELDDYLRSEAAKYRQLAQATPVVHDRDDYLDLAKVCEEVANKVEDRLTGG
jgi:hypothetical protein